MHKDAIAFKTFLIPKENRKVAVVAMIVNGTLITAYCDAEGQPLPGQRAGVLMEPNVLKDFIATRGSDELSRAAADALDTWAQDLGAAG